MSETIRQPFKLHLPGLLKVLAEHLYSNKQVAVRELIQNAHDGCRRRQAEGKDKFSPRIDLKIDAARRKLIISDNGAGLTRSEIEDYLATIGRSYTRELRENLAALAPDEAAQLIGQFGFGFLSAFLLASHVRVVTKSIAGGEALAWSSTGDEEYEIAPATRDEPGTTIELEIKSSAAFVLRENLLLEAVRQYADFLPIPIFLNGEAAPANLQRPPWETSDPDKAARDYIERAFGTSEPLCVIALHDHVVELERDRMGVPLRGFLFVPPGSVASLREYGDALVFIRRMFICRDDKNLLPPWARFVRGVVDCPHLQPTASREDLHQDETFEIVRGAIEEQLAAGLQKIARDEPEVWEKIVRGHTDVLTGWASRDSAFFEAVCDLVTFRTSRGPLNLPDYLEQSGGDFYFTTRELGSVQEKMLAEGHGVPVIDASWFGVQPFLAQYAARKRRAALIQLDGDTSGLLRPVHDSKFDDLLEFFARKDVEARVASFRPPEVPALMFYPEDAEFALESRQALDAGEIADPLARLLGDYVENSLPSQDEIAGQLVLNASNPFVLKLADQEESAARDAAAELLLHVARLFSGRTLTAGDAAKAFLGVTGALELLGE